MAFFFLKENQEFYWLQKPLKIFVLVVKEPPNPDSFRLVVANNNSFTLQCQDVF